MTPYYAATRHWYNSQSQLKVCANASRGGSDLPLYSLQQPTLSYLQQSRELHFDKKNKNDEKGEPKAWHKVNHHKVKHDVRMRGQSST